MFYFKQKVTYVCHLNLCILNNSYEVNFGFPR